MASMLGSRVGLQCPGTRASIGARPFTRGTTMPWKRWVGSHALHGYPTVVHAGAEKSLAQSIDDELSKRDLALDPLGYFIITVDRASDPPMIQADYYSNTINDQGLACDEDGEVIGCGSGNKKVLLPLRVFRGRTAKEVSVEILESQGVGVPCEYCSHLEHANYLGRELQKAEFCMNKGETYVQD